MSFLIIIGIIISHVLLAQSSYNEDNDSSVDCRKDCVELPAAGSETFPLSLQTWVTSHIVFLDNICRTILRMQRAVVNTVNNMHHTSNC